MFKDLRIGTKILVIILFTSLTALLSISIISYTEMLNLTQYSQNANIQLGITSSTKSQEALLSQAEAFLKKIAIEQANNINAVLYQVESELGAARDFTEKLYANPDNFIGYELPLPDKTEHGVAAAKYMLPIGVEKTQAIKSELRILSNAEYMLASLVAHNVNLDNIYMGTENGISYRYSSSSAYDKKYDPRKRSWYQDAFNNKREIVWLDTYLDPFGSIGVTAAMAFNNEQNKIHGVIATDITLDSITHIILNTKIGKAGYAFLLDNKGSYIAHPKYSEKNFEKSPSQKATGSWADVLEDMNQGKTGVDVATIDGSEKYIAYAPLPVSNWSLGIVVPIDEVTLPARETKVIIDQYIIEAQNYIHQTLSDILMDFIVLFTLCTMTLVFFAFIFSKTITKPLKQLLISAEHIGKGNLDNPIEETSKDEVGQLAKAFNAMAANLKQYITNLSTVIAEKESINSELNVAANIQNDMLPRIFPIFSDLDSVRIFAQMTPAKEVGGDFYDVFFIDEAKTKLCCIIADVSGKGVPASLFMVITKTILKSNISLGKNLQDAIIQANLLLAEDNNSCMFVTVFSSILDLSTGEFTYVNCGHNPPLLCRKGERFEYMNITPSLPLAATDFSPYMSEQIMLQAGDIIYMYTDGITEAMNKNNVIFSDNTLLNDLNLIPMHDALEPEEIDIFIRAKVEAFVDGANQSDDITTLVLKYTQK